MKNWIVCIVVIFLYSCLESSLYGQNKSLGSMLSIADSIFHKNKDSALVLYQDIYEQAILKKDTTSQQSCLLKMVNIHYRNMNFPEALSLIDRALDFADEKQSTADKVFLLKILGNIYRKFGDVETGEKYIFESYHLTRKAINEKIIEPSALLSSFLNIIELDRQKNDNISAMAYIDSCFMLIDSLNYPTSKIVSLLRIKANILTKNENLKPALKILLSIDQYYDSISSATSSSAVQIFEQPLVASCIARVYQRQNRNGLALQYFQKSLRLIRNLNEKLDHQAYVLTQISKLYEQKGQHQLAFRSLLEANEYSNKYLVISSERNKRVHKILDVYKGKLDKKAKEVMAKNLILAKQEKAILQFRVLLLIILCWVIASAFVVWNKYEKNKHRNEQAFLKEKTKYVQEQLVCKNNELASFSLQLLERDDLLEHFSDYVKTDNSKEAKVLKFTCKQLQGNTWKEFEKRFIEVNEGFYERLLQRFPNLTINDQKYCALVKLNLKGKEISKLLGITEKSVHMARYRIRKKLQMKTDMNLEVFLNKI